MTPALSFRPASEHDINFLWTLRQQTMKAYIENSYGWNNDVEYEYAKEHLSCTRIIQINNSDIGIVKAIEFEDHFHLQQIQLRPEWANRGIGSQVMKGLIRDAHIRNKTIRLHVLKNNPAKNLYARLGFIAIDEFKYQLLMEHPAKAAI